MEGARDAKSGLYRRRAEPENSPRCESYWEMVFDSTMTSPNLVQEKNQPIRLVVDAERAKETAYELAMSGVGNFFVI